MEGKELPIQIWRNHAVNRDTWFVGVGPLWYLAVDMNQTIVSWNSSAQRILGYETEDVMGRRC